MTKKRFNNALFFFALFIGMFCIFFFTPYVVDDFLEKEAACNCTLTECIRKALLYGNGRFLGNIGLYICLRYDMIRAFMKPLIITVMSVCFSYLFNLRCIWEKLIAAIVLVIPARGFFSNCYINNPCFYNYVAPIAFFLLALSIIKYLEECKKSKFVLILLLFVVSFSMQFFSENSSIIFILFSLGLNIYDFYLKKKLNISKIVMLITSVIGFAIMFFLPNFLATRFELTYNMLEYRSLYFSFTYIIGVLAKFTEAFTSAYIIIVLLSVAEVYIICKTSLNGNIRKYQIAIPISYSMTSLIYTFVQGSELKVDAVVKLFLLVLFSIFLINSIVVFISFIKSFNDKMIVCFLVIIAMVSVGMFTILSQQGYRTFYLPICIVSGIVFYIYNIIKKDYGVGTLTKKVTPVLSKAMACFAMSITVILSMQMIQNYTVYLMRERYVSEKIEQGETEIKIPKLPNKQLHCENYMMPCKNYLKSSNENVNIVFVELDEWEKYEEYQSLQDNPVGNIVYVFKNYNYNNKPAN